MVGAGPPSRPSDPGRWPLASGGMATELQARILAVVRDQPPGSVTTYGEVAAEAGAPGAARAVGHTLAASGGDVPWWRVVSAGGRLVPGLEEEHARRLRAEGVDVRDGHVAALARRRGR